MTFRSDAWRGACVLAAFLVLMLGCEQQSADAATEALADDAAPTEVLDPAAAADTAQTPEPALADTLTLPETNYYAIETPQGRMVVRLFDATPLHRDNFKKLAATQFFDSTQFHRIIEGFMIQGGDPNSRDGDPLDDGQGGPGYTIPAEIRPEFYHRRGALAAARQGDQVNPERRSSGSQFYIVHGAPLEDAQLDEMQAAVRQRTGDASFTFPDSVRAAYRAEGGAPFLDRQYTVFGELVEGYDVLDKIAATSTPRKAGLRSDPRLVDHPTSAIRMSVEPLPNYTPPESAP